MSSGTNTAKGIRAVPWALVWFVACITFGFGLPATAATFNDAEVRKQLDRLMFPEQYLLDVTIVAPTTTATAAEQPSRPLPGLPFFGDARGDAASIGLTNGIAQQPQDGLWDVLLVIDVGVSDERARLAEEVLRRYSDASGIKSKMRLTVRRDPILKVAPPELAPLPARQPEPVKAAQAEEHPKKSDNIYDFIENRRDLATRTLLVVWTALASLVAIFALLSRRNKQTPAERGLGAGLGADGAAKSSEAASTEAAKKALTKDQIYSQDAALHKLAQEIVNESAKQPEKVAGVLGRWIGDSVENAKYANLFLRNCDIATVESICRHLHPSDVEKLIENEVSDFDPFSSENKKVLDLMRAELARLAAKQVFQQRPEPMAFLKTVSDTDLAKILSEENLKTVAMIATQLPMHRLQTYFAGQPENRLQEMMREVVDLEDVRAEQLNVIARRLQDRIQNMDQLVVDDAAVDEAARQVVSVIRDPIRQLRLAATLQRQNMTMFKKVRMDVLLASDLRHFGARPAKIIFQAIDGEQLGMALAGVPGDTPEWIATLPEAFAASYQQARSRTVELKEREAAWQRIQRVIADLVGSGLVTGQEANQAKAQTDQWLPAMLGSVAADTMESEDADDEIQGAA